MDNTRNPPPKVNPIYFHGAIRGLQVLALDHQSRDKYESRRKRWGQAIANDETTARAFNAPSVRVEETPYKGDDQRETYAGQT